MTKPPVTPTTDSQQRLSPLTKAYLIVAPLPLIGFGLLALIYAVGFDRCDKNCVAPESSIYVPVLGFIVGGVLLAAAGTAIVSWRSESRRGMARNSILLTVRGVALWMLFAAIFVTLSVETTT